VFRTGDLTTHPRDIMYAALTGDRTPRPLVATDALEMTRSCRPMNTGSRTQQRIGRFEVYVRRFPGADGRIQVSVGGGRNRAGRRTDAHSSIAPTDR
jgi:hypothetical protein